MTIEIITDDKTVKVKSSYNTSFIREARNLGGKWKNPFWEFDIRNESYVRQACLDVYGTDGITDPDTVTVRVEFTNDDYTLHGPIEVFGRTVAIAFGRDSGAKLGDDIVLLGGSFNSGGSVKNWKTIVYKGTVVLMHDVPRKLVQDEIDSGTANLYYTIVDNIDRNNLIAEKERLLNRLNQINYILNEK